MQIDLVNTQHPMTIGQLTDALDGFDDDHEVYYGFGYARPDGRLFSYRGYYECAALGYDPDGSKDTNLTVGQLKALLIDAIRPGVTHEGWKGGDYTFALDTQVWVSNPREVTACGVIGVQLGSEFTTGVYLITANCSR